MDQRIPENIFEFDVSQIPRPKIPFKMILMIIGVVVVLLLMFDSFYQVQPEEVGVVLRFGAYNRTTEPGLRFKIPLAEDMIRVAVQRQLKHEFGFRTVEAGVRSSYSVQNYLQESSMLSGDLNVAVVEWIVQYRVADPQLYLFRVRNVEDTFRDMNEATMRQVVGDRTVSEVLTVGRQDIESTVKVALQTLADQYQTGITVDQVVLQDVNPPDPVKPSWDEVNQAEQQRDRLINEAQAQYNQVIPRARGEAQQTILQAEGYALDRVNRSEGDAARFKALYEEYRRAPEVTRQRLYLETMQQLLPKLGGKLYIDEDAQGVLPLLPLESLQNIVPNAAGQQQRQQENDR
jgi:membrane protease subunit HflK